MRDRRHLVVFLITLFVSCLALGSCRKGEQPAETNTKGNATDRDAASGTSGTGEPASPSTATTAAAQQLGTVAPSAANGTIALTGTDEVHAQKTETTSTLQGPGGTSTASVATPTDTTATIKTPVGTSTAAVKKH
jgi:cytoskeletal protein RodZ